MGIPYEGQPSFDARVFNFSKGFISDLSPLGYPQDSCVDINDFELLLDGTVRRRKGLRLETSGANNVLASTNNIPTGFEDTWTWINWTSHSNTRYIVLQYGYYLHFYTQGAVLSSGKSATLIDLRHYVGYGGLTGNILTSRVSFATGNGDLLVSGPYNDTIYIREEGGQFTCRRIDPVIRCFADSKDAIPMNHRPNNASGEYTVGHRFNLRNRGWLDYGTSPAYAADDEGITKYIATSDAAASLDFAPSKALIAYKGYRPGRGSDTSIAYDFLFKHIDAQVVGGGSAPIGAIKHRMYRQDKAHQLTQRRHASVLDIAAATGVKNKPLNVFSISSWTDSTGYAWPASTGAITITLTLPYDISRGGVAGSWAGAPIANVEFEIFGSQFTYTDNACPNTTFTGTLDGVYTGTINTIAAGPAPGSTTVVFTFQTPYRFTAFVNRTLQYGYVALPWTNTQALNNVAYTIAPETTLTTNPTADNALYFRLSKVGFYAGRVWLANMNSNVAGIDSVYANKLYFSKVVIHDADYNVFYQENDPTAEYLNTLNGNDGGYIEIPDLGKVLNMITVQSSLVVFTTHGVWEVRGAQGFFAADDFMVRKITDVPPAFEESSNYKHNHNLVCLAEGLPYYVARTGMYRLVQDPNSGYLTAENLTDNRISDYWISKSGLFDRGQIVYDSILKRVMFIFRDSALTGGTAKNTILLYDLRLNGFYKYRVPSATNLAMMGAVVLDTNIVQTEYSNVKFFIRDQTGANTIFTICDFNQTSFADYTNAQSVPYLTAAYDLSAGDVERARQGQYVLVYMRRTETSFSPVTNDSSLTMQARWDWTDNANSGKISTGRQVYRHLRPFTPSGPSDISDGYPVVVTKNKVRGTGRNLHLHFEGATSKDAHLYGWAINYKGSRRI